MDKLIVGSVMKSGEKYAAAGQVRSRRPSSSCASPRSTPRTARRPRRCNNAAVVLEKAKKQEEAVAAYKELAEQYPQASEAPEALFTAARIEENIAYYDKAAALYEQLASRVSAEHPRRRRAPQRRACCARAWASTICAIKHYGEYARRFKDKSDAKEVAFHVGLVREDQKD